MFLFIAHLTSLQSENNKPVSTFLKLSLGKERRRAFRTIRKHLGGTNYRRDLIEVSTCMW